MTEYNHIELNNQITKRKNNGMGFFDLEKDQEALREYLREIEDKTIHFEDELSRLRYLIENNFYYNLFREYSENEVNELLEYTNSHEFKFASYMSASKFYKDYALKTNDKKQYLENYHQHVLIVAIYLAKGDKEVAKQLINAMMEQRYQPATPTFDVA